MTKPRSVLICGDFHIPYQDKAAVKQLLAAVRQGRWDELVVLGDLVDFEAFSRFLKDPRKVADPQAELDIGRQILNKLRLVAGPKCKLTFLLGNHEERLEKYLLKNAPALLPLRSLNLHELLGLDGWRVVPPNQFYKTGSLVVLHGQSYGPTTNAKNIAKFGGFNVVQGHSHRLSQTFVRSLHGTHSAVEAGCLCDLEPSFCHKPNWQSAYVTFDGAHLHLHPL